MLKSHFNLIENNIYFRVYKYKFTILYDIWYLVFSIKKK